MFNSDKVYKSSIPEAICIDEFTYKNKTSCENVVLLQLQQFI